MSHTQAASTQELERILGRVLLIGSGLSPIVFALGLTLAVLWPAHSAGDWLFRAGLAFDRNDGARCHTRGRPHPGHRPGSLRLIRQIVLQPHLLSLIHI